ncbi:Lipoprotein LipO precursor [Streptomyces sp. YIM 130001]|uniref:extracellular solute-binding protein n=1 Tax=Streptomyces sp. YIM 130001 TaxID=2259644 RepID=UPI000EF07F3B|nr:extracellular solute-binding protein [Streptomyces sp. YIM 130001]RII13037.1 Lipoprotein LipO precursor [Streptomyces sp. YIM 130001]
MGKPMNRRSFVSGVGGLLLGSTGIASLAGCSTVTRSTDIKAMNRGVKLPAYRPWEGPKPDLPASGRIPAAFRHYPKDTERTITRRPGDGSRLSGTVPVSGPIPPGVDQNRYWRELNRQLNLDIELNMAPGPDFPDKLQTSIAGDTLGDVWNIFGTPPYLPQLLQAKAQDLTPYLSGSEILKYPFLANLPTESWRGCVFAGKIYAVPVVRGVLAANTMLSRADLFRKRGVDPNFTSIDELLEIGRKMTDERRNMWAFSQVPNTVLSTMLDMPNVWKEENGRFTHESEMEERKEQLEVGRRMSAEGMLHPDAINSFNGKVWFPQGATAMIQDTFSGLPSFYQQATVDDFEIAMPTIPGPDGKPGKVWFAPNNSITAISATSPERTRMILEVLNWAAAPFGTKEYTFRKYGIEGHDFNFKDGEPRSTRAGNSETVLTYFPLGYFVDTAPPIYYAGFPDAADAVYENLRHSAESMILNAGYGLYSPTYASKQALLGTLLDNAAKDIYRGRKPVSSWDETMKDWRARGGEAIRREFEEAQETRER